MTVENGLMRFFLLIAITIILILSGCIRNIDSILTKNCEAFEHSARQDCYFEQATYLAIDRNPDAAMARCRQMLGSIDASTTESVLTAAKAFLDTISGGSTRHYFNRCVTNVAVLSVDDSWCSNTLKETVFQFIDPSGVLADDPHLDCISKVQTEKRQQTDLDSSRLLAQLFTTEPAG